ncbi:hypothetical protein DPSP01_002949 [Paraphaeosphaeria sporulosa]|uniref:Galactose oxidase n=1 Tax=Paraphaeosphaeria sporulosa TaxID=1460663 RepID=A0A177CN71_9PLEO|nr:galactose oxidase [Paraphaeosphaeria sporulosa]OAG08197.1 galactose oxidase [Paraphaeosphaeria sporulosa]
MEPAAAGALYAAENLLSGAAALVKGITHPTLPLKANLTRIESVPLPRSGHSLSVVKGRAYVFGGETAHGELADNDMHIIILPSSGVLEADYTTLKARPETAGGAVPASRKGHSSVVIGDSIYIFGGEGVQEENGRIWVLDTLRNTWSFLDPAPDTAAPAHRTGHAAVASGLPGPRNVTYKEKAPQQPVDPAKVVPEPADADSWGTIFVVGGRETGTGDLAKDALAFDVRSRTWSNIPTPDGPPTEGASLALVGNSLYLFGGKTATETGESATAKTQVLDASSVWQHAEDGTTPLASGWAWDSLSASSAANSSSSLTPSPRFAAGLEDVTTGQGRHYLLLFGGSSPAPDNNITLLDDVWAFQLPSERASAAIAKDAVRAGLKRETHEAHWAEVGCRYMDTRGDELAQEKSGIKGFGSRSGFAAAKGTEVDGASVVVWGGVDAEGRILSDGWLITAER